MSKIKKSVFGKKADTLIKQREKRLLDDQKEFREFVTDPPITELHSWRQEKVTGGQLRFQIHPKKGKPKWSKTPNYRLPMIVGIWIKTEKSYKLYKTLHTTPQILRASSRDSWEASLDSVFNPIKQETNYEISISGRTLRDALAKLSIPMIPAHRIAVTSRLNYIEDGEKLSSDGLSYVESFDEMKNHKSMLQCFTDGLADQIRGSLARKELTFTNHKNMEKIYTKHSKKVKKILDKYGIELDESSTTFQLLEKLLESAGFSNLEDASEFGAKQVVKDYNKLKEIYIPKKQLDSKLEKDEINRVSIMLTYRYIPRVKRN